MFPPPVNPKRLENGLNVIQLETAVGSAIHNFEGAIGWLHTGSKLGWDQFFGQGYSIAAGQRSE